MTYLLVKLLHIVSSTLLFGTGIGSAFYLLCASLQRRPQVVASVAGFVVIGDWLFTSTSIIIQPVTGFYLAAKAGYPFWEGWILWSTVLYVIAALCWLPVILLQMRLRDAARACAVANIPLSQAYWRLFRLWFALGIPAFAALVAVFFLMVLKPA